MAAKEFNIDVRWRLFRFWPFRCGIVVLTVEGKRMFGWVRVRDGEIEISW
jgi:hypothetical protein